jgi:hypothetical protein
MLNRVVRKLGWLAVPTGLLAAAFSVASLWFLLALKDHSSTLRDAYEAPAGIMQYTVFGAACLGLLLLFAGGVAAFVLGLRSGSRGA